MDKQVLLANIFTAKSPLLMAFLTTCTVRHKFEGIAQVGLNAGSLDGFLVIYQDIYDCPSADARPELLLSSFQNWNKLMAALERPQLAGNVLVWNGGRHLGVMTRTPFVEGQPTASCIPYFAKFESRAWRCDLFLEMSRYA